VEKIDTLIAALERHQLASTVAAMPFACAETGPCRRLAH
jgi:hypothetical protein